MSANKHKNTKPEMALRKAMWSSGIRGYRLHWKTVPGTPDIVFLSKRKAIFVNGCFWHRCPNCQLPLPKSHSQFWSEKLSKNVERDTKKSFLLEENGWGVLIVWECQIKANINSTILQIKKLLK